MIELQERDQALHDLYHNRTFWVFLNGKTWWDKKVYDIHWDWLQSGSWSKVDDIDVQIAIIGWAADNKYLETAE